MSNLLEKLIDNIGLIKKSQVRSFAEKFASADPFVLWKSSKKVSAQAAMDVYTGWVYGSTKAIAEEIGLMTFELYKVGKDKNYKRVYDHELLDLLNAPYPNQIGFNQRYKTAAHLEATGNAYWLLLNVKDETSKPDAIFPLNPRYLKIETDGQFPGAITKYKYRKGNKEYEFDPYQIIHFQYPDPDDDFEGIGTVQSIAQWIDSDNYANEFNRRFFLNGARLSGVLTSDSNLSNDQLIFLQKSFEAVHKGAENAYGVAALPKGVNYEEKGVNPKDMDFVEGQRSSRDRILSGFRVPKTILGTAESETNRATAETADYVFASRTIKPKMELMCAYLNAFLVPRYGEDLYITFTDPVPENREMRIQEMQAATANQPVMSVNEAREEYFGLEEINNGDAVMTDFSKVPLGEPAKKAQKQRIKFIRYKKKNNRKEISESIAEKAAEILKDIEIKKNEIIKKDITTLSDAEYEVVWKAMVGRVTPYEKRQAEAVKQFNDKLFDEVLKNLENVVKSKAINENDLIDNFDASVGALVDISEPIQTDLFVKEAKEALALLGIDDFNVLTPEVKKALKKSLELMSESYNNTALQLLKGKLEQGLEEGAGLRELKDLVMEVKDFSDEVRAERVARTESFRVANSASREAWKQSGVVKSMKWYTSADELVCEYCGAMQGAIADMDSKFFEDDYGTGENPPLHVNCRCSIRPSEINLE